MRILLATDVFPPRCGGSGWSTYHLARALRDRGHEIAVVRAALNPARARTYDYDGFHVDQIVVPVPPVPVLRNLAKNELFWGFGSRALAGHAQRLRADVIHGQHVMTIPAAERVGRRLGVPVVATVRDYWATCPISTRLRPDGICHACTTGRLHQCLGNHHPIGTMVVIPLAGYVANNRRRRQTALRAVARVVAVSHYVAEDLRLHAGVEAQVIPNMVDVPSTALPAPDGMTGINGPRVVYAGKLDWHKGADRLPKIMASGGAQATLVVIGDGPLRERLVADCHARGVAVRFYTQLPNATVLRWLAHASAVLTPARWPEPLSRVWLEAASVGCPIVSTPVGGARDAIIDGETGFLASDDDTLGQRLGQVLNEEGLRARLGANARRLALKRFDTPIVVSQMESLYESVAACHGR